MKLIIFILICIIGFMSAYIYGEKWMYQYEIQGQARWDGTGWETYKIFTKPRIFPPVGLGYYTKTILELKEDGYWYTQIGDKEMIFKKIISNQK